MKNLRRLLLFIIITFNVHPASAQKHDFAWWYRFENANKEIGLPSKGEKRVIMFGNSITEYWPYKHGEWFSSNHIIGRGIGGQTTYQFLLRFYDDVINLQPKVVVINGAINDIAENTGPYSEDHTFDNICSMVEMARQNKITVVLTSVLPAHQFNWHPGIADPMGKVRSLNARIKAYAKANRITYVDYFSAMVSADGTRMQEDLADDGVHPNEKGYSIMESMILPIINKLRK